MSVSEPLLHTETQQHSSQGVKASQRGQGLSLGTSRRDLCNDRYFHSGATAMAPDLARSFWLLLHLARSLLNWFQREFLVAQLC